jgi:hypothetical protein
MASVQCIAVFRRVCSLLAYFVHLRFIQEALKLPCGTYRMWLHDAKTMLGRGALALP